MYPKDQTGKVVAMEAYGAGKRDRYDDVTILLDEDDEDEENNRQKLEYARVYLLFEPALVSNLPLAYVQWYEYLNEEAPRDGVFNQLLLREGDFQVIPSGTIEGPVLLIPNYGQPNTHFVYESTTTTTI